MPAGMCSDSDSFYGSSYPASTSPNLPFAFTPSQHSYASIHDSQVPRQGCCWLGQAAAAGVCTDGCFPLAKLYLRKPSSCWRQHHVRHICCLASLAMRVSQFC